MYDRYIKYIKFVEKYGDKMNVIFYNWKEEVVNVIMYGIGFIFSIFVFVLFIIFVVGKDNFFYLISFLIYGIFFMLFYICFILFYSFKFCKVWMVFNIMDYVVIYVLIVGSYMLFVLIMI